MATRYKLYEEDGSTLVYEFDFVTDDPGIFGDPASSVEHTSLRGQGSIVSEGSNEAYDLTLNFILKGVDYFDLVDQIDDLKSTITKFTKYILKVQSTEGGSTIDFKVMRLTSFQFPNIRRTKRTRLQDVILVFRVDCWA